ncbi:antimicrobial peptide system SdpB family protein [Mycolicibacterium mucogenicum 261Sha1.1M5]|nr:antimicrobial peptide system SdpB family protein [Mycolicibacterium mucogenicum 261Sha1.1M5]
MRDSLTQTWARWILKHFGKDPFGPFLQLGRSLLATGTFLTLTFNPAETLFHSASPSGSIAVQCSRQAAIGAFCLVPTESLDVVRLVLAAACIPAIIGLFPFVSSTFHLFAAFSLSNNAIGIEGGDQLTVNLTFLLALASFGDRRMWGWVERRAHGTHLKFIPSNVLLWTITIQVAFVYLEAGLVKSKEAIWAEGSALWYWVQNSAFGISREFSHTLMSALSPPLMSAAATWGTIVLEISIAVIFLFAKNQKLRQTAIFLGILFHLAIALIMGLVTFFFAMAGALFLGGFRPRDGYPLGWFRRLRKTGPSSSKPSLETRSPRLNSFPSHYAS